MKKPSQFVPWMQSFIAVLFLIGFVFMAASNASVNLLKLYGACVAGLSLLAIGMWKKYFEALMDYKIQELQGTDKNNV
jgi:hypothetical protein